MTAGRVLAALAAALMASAPAPAPLQAQQRQVTTVGPDPNQGRLVAIGGQAQSGRAACVQCHGLDGLGDTSGAFPRLAGLGGWYLYKSLRDYAAGLRPSDIMGPIAAGLSDKEMQDVASFYGGLDDLPYNTPVDPDARVRQAGGAIVAVGLPEKGVPACQSCHGPSGAGGGLIYPRIAGQYAPYLEHQLTLWREGRRDGDAMNVMEQIAKSMSEDEIRAVARYLAAVDPLDVSPPPEDPPELEPTAGAAPPYLDSGAAPPSLETGAGQ